MDRLPTLLAHASSKSQLALRFEMVGNCGPDTLPVYGENFELRPFGRSSLVGLYYDLVVKRNLPAVSRTNVVFETCRERLAPHTCTRFISWRFRKESCAKLEEKNAIWTSLLDYDPPLNCPFRKGVYHLSNASLDLSKVAKLNYPLRGIMRFRIESFGEEPAEQKANSLVETQFSCTQYELSGITIRKNSA